MRDAERICASPQFSPLARKLTKRKSGKQQGWVDKGASRKCRRLQRRVRVEYSMSDMTSNKISGQAGLCICERGQLTFGENGAVILLTDRQGNIAREMDDFEMLDQNRPRCPELALIATLVMLSSTILVIVGSIFGFGAPIIAYFPITCLGLVALFTIVAAAGCYREALENGEVGDGKNGIDQPSHITGLGGAVAIFLTLTISLIFAMGQKWPTGLELPESVGNGTIFALASVFVLVFLSSRVPAPQSVGDILDKLRRWTNGVLGLGKLLSRIDAALVFGVAPLGGMTVSSPFFRYTLLLTQIGCGGLLTWFAPTPFGLVSAAWVFLLVFAVVRRWGWIEHIRAVRLNDPSSADNRKINKMFDLRDEAMVSLLLLVVVMPVAMRQVHLAVPEAEGFLISGNASEHFLSWTGFFGVELLKALPFLDWADIYGAENAALIKTSGAISMHSVFVARLIIDLVFLAALVQWVSISVAIEKNKRDFLAKKDGVTSLDERIERNHLSRLVNIGKDGEYIPTLAVNQYTHYDTLALSRLKLRYKNDARLMAAIRAISRASGKAIEVPSEQLLEEAYMAAPRPERLMEILNVVEQEKDFDLDNLLEARSELNRKGRLENERKRLVQVLVRHATPSVERDVSFAEILSGENADSLRDVRRLVIDTLVRNAKRNPAVIDYVRRAAELDVSKVVREHALRSMTKFGISRQPTTDAALLA